MQSLFKPARIGELTLNNRVVMAPLTRNRAGSGQVPTALMATYYEQRATAGLLIAEATQVSPVGQGYRDTPGIHTSAQIAGWRRVTKRVHARGGRIALQLWHVGRISHECFQPSGATPVSSTGRRANAKTYTARGFEPVSMPRALRTNEIAGIVDEFRRAAGAALDAGFDGVEIHGASGYLIDQFLRDSINDRSDEYGGSVENRVRFPLQVVRAVASEIGAGRTGLRVSPVTPVNDAGQDSAAQALFEALIDGLSPTRLAFVHVIEGSTSGERDAVRFDYAALRRRLRLVSGDTAWIANNGYTRQSACDALATGAADLVSFGRAFVSNPDLVERLRTNAPIAELDRNTLYGGGEAGYTDYLRHDAKRLTRTPAALSL